MTLENFDDVGLYENSTAKVSFIEALLMTVPANEIVSLKEIYLDSAFTILRNGAFNLIQNFFLNLTTYYNIMFGIFIALLCIF
jgi:hypothetical protein